ncbi:Apolipoprotein N-acyltransferase [Desulfovibrionales bacterium]
MFITLFIAVLSAWLGFANPVGQLPVTVLFYPAALAWIGSQAATRTQAFCWGTITGGLASAACLYWIAVPVHDFGGLPWILAMPCPLLLGSYLGLYTGCFSLGVRCVANRLPWWAFSLFTGALWAILEALRGWLFTGFTWLVLPSAFVPWPAMIQTAALWGSWGLSAFLTATACLPLSAICHCPPSGSIASRFIVSSLLAIVLLTGLWLIGSRRIDIPLPNQHSLKIGIVQGNINQSHKWNPAYQLTTIEHYIALSRHLVAEQRPQLLIWPETAMPFFFQDEGPLAIIVHRLAAETHTPILAGAPGYLKLEYDKIDDTSPDNQNYAIFNRAWLLDDCGHTVAFYDKEHLVPFGEYIPLSNWLQHEHYCTFLTNLLQGIGDFVPGHKIDPLKLQLLNQNGYTLDDQPKSEIQPAPETNSTPNTPDMFNQVPLGVLICYETVFPELAQKRVAAGATLFINISNDAWFGHTAAPLQHIQLSALRAVEQGRYMVRSTNTGISAVIDPMGRIHQKTNLFETTAFTATVQTIAGKTMFHQSFAMVLPVLSVVVIVLFIWAWKSSDKNRKDANDGIITSITAIPSSNFGLSIIYFFKAYGPKYFTQKRSPHVAVP